VSADSGGLQFVPTTTQAVVVCPRCGQAVILPLIQVEVSVGHTIETFAGEEFPISLNAELLASGPHSCPREE